MLSGRADPRRDGVADQVAHLSAALGRAGVEIVPAAAADLVHVQYVPGATPRLGRVPGPVVTTLHAYGRPAPWWLPAGPARLLERAGLWDRDTGRTAPRSAALLTTTDVQTRLVRERLGRAAVRLPLPPTVPDAGPVDRAAARHRLGLPGDAEVVVFFGFVHPGKGLLQLVEALARLRGAARRRLHLLVVGGFTSSSQPEPEARAVRQELVGWARTCGVAPHVTITGHLPAAEVSAALHAADAAAFPFTAGITTTSGGLLAAFAHALPTLVTLTDVPDPELVDGESVVVAPRSTDALALVDALARLLDDEGLRRKVAAGGAAVPAGRSWDEVAATHRAVYAEVLRGRERDG